MTVNSSDPLTSQSQIESKGTAISQAEDRLIRWTRPGQSWLFAFAGIVYAFTIDPSFEIVCALFASPWAYAGLRQVGKGVDSVMSGITTIKGNKNQ